MRYFVTLLMLFILLLSACSNPPEIKSYKLWYNKPAQEWNEALPVGNGRLGAMVFGQHPNERIQLNEESIWAGSQINNNNPQAFEHLAEIQQLLFTGQIEKAYRTAGKYMIGTPPQVRSYQPLGDLLLSHTNFDSLENYKRSLELNSGVSSVAYTYKGSEFTQTTFASAIDDIIVVHMVSEGSEKINLSIELDREKDAIVEAQSDNSIILHGQIQDEPDPLSGPGGAHMKFAAKAVARSDGSLHSKKSNLYVKDATFLTLLITATTDYNLSKLNYDRSIDPLKKCNDILKAVENYSYAQILKDHVQDHKSLFERVELDLGSEPSDLPTDQRLENVKNGGYDPGLVELYFQLGRYLLMGSSRMPGVLPANLQGIWNDKMNAPWNSDFHTNINLQMNYWPAEVCNLVETIGPLNAFMQELVKPGTLTAKETYGGDGWTLHHLTDPFGRTGVADGIWGVSPLAGPWMTFPIWRHYEFTQDEEFLRKEAYPLLKGSAEFVLDFLVEGPDGYLATAPSHSPENRFFIPGTDIQSYLTYSATIDIQIVDALFDYCIEAAEVLDVDAEFREQMKQAKSKLPPIQIGKDGTLNEWIKDYKEVEPGHRHMSHMLGLYPLAQFTPDQPDLFAAARATLEKRLVNGGGHTGWSRAWIISFFARLLDGEKAHENLYGLLRKSTLSNLFDTHPPFQIDGNFGGTAGIAEMLLQSHNGKVRIMPALPKAWATGHVKGLKARGNFEIDIIWKDGELEKVNLKSLSGNKCKLVYGDNQIEFETQSGKNYSFNKNLK
jgi:alpha-L-fucosidase 2